MKNNFNKNKLVFNFDLKDNILAMTVYSVVAFILGLYKYISVGEDILGKRVALLLVVLAILGVIITIRYKGLNSKELVDINWQSVKVKEIKYLLFVKETEILFKDVKSVRITPNKITIKGIKESASIRVQFIGRTDYKLVDKYLNEISKKYRFTVTTM